MARWVSAESEGRLYEDAMVSLVPPCSPQHGLRANWVQVSAHLLLALLIGVSMRLVLLPAALLATKHTDFLIYFGVAKSLAGLVGGTLADRWGRKRTCFVGWLCGVAIVPVLCAGVTLQWPVLKGLSYILLGLQQGLTWGVNIICLMDILGPRGRGNASALSNAVGYFGSAFAAPPVAHLVSKSGDELWALAILGVLLLVAMAVLAFTKNTELWLATEGEEKEEASNKALRLQTGCRGAPQVLCSLAGLTVNTATGLVWGGAVLWFKSEGGLDRGQIGLVEAWHTYAKVLAMLAAGWAVYYIDAAVVASAAMAGLAVSLGVLSLLARRLPDYASVAATTSFVGASVGVAFPSVMAVVTANTPTQSRASVYGAYRMWRDLGYAVGGLASEVLSDAGFETTSIAVFLWSSLVACVFAGRLVICSVLKARQLESSSGDSDVEMTSSSS